MNLVSNNENDKKISCKDYDLVIWKILSSWYKKNSMRSKFISMNKHNLTLSNKTMFIDKPLSQI